jgi:hypothetical protein
LAGHQRPTALRVSPRAPPKLLEKDEQ